MVCAFYENAVSMNFRVLVIRWYTTAPIRFGLRENGGTQSAGKATPNLKSGDSQA